MTKLQTTSKELQLLFSIAGIYVSYITFGIFQEKIMRHPFGEKKERFNFTSFLLMQQCLVNALCAWMVMKVLRLPKDNTPVFKYCWISLSSILAMFCSNKALLDVDYPTQVLAKSCKPIPVMLMGLIVFNKKYPLAKYICVFMVTAGISLFMVTHQVGTTGTTSTLGLVLLLASLALDGLTGPFQDDLFKKHSPTSPHMMYYSNLWATLFMFIAVLITGDLQPTIDFCTRFPEIIPQIILFSITSAVGQNFIYYLINHFNSLTCTTVTTSRKFFTILASVVWFDNSLSAFQWFTVFLVFAGLGVDAYSAYSRNRRAHEH